MKVGHIFFAMTPDALPAGLAEALADRYRVERPLGAGGMAMVFLAHDVRHDRPVAIKVVRPDLSAALGAERFLTEIKVTARLQHPHILGLLDSGIAAGALYYAMPYVAGESLRDRLAREKLLPIPEALRVAGEVASALDYAHRHGVIHRDIKPENILLHDGQALVADFGIALAVQSAGGERLTQTGLSLGTPQYMSPEQALGERTVDARSDVYSLAAVLYEMLTGDPPFTGNTVQAIVARVMSERPARPRTLRDTIPAHAEDAVLTALEKLPADRFGSAAEFASAIREPSPGRNAAWAPASAATSASRRSTLRLVAATIAVLAIGAVAGRTWLSPSGGGPRLWSIALPDSALLVFVGESSLGLGEPSLAVAPDGRRIVYAGRRGGRSTLMLHEGDSFEVRPIPGTEGATHPFFSPTGEEVAFFAAGQLKKVSLSGGAPTVLADVVQPRGGVWTQENRIIVANREGTRLSAIPAAGGVLTVIQNARQAGVLSPSRVPGSPWLLHSSPSISGVLAVTSTETGETRFLRSKGPPTASASGTDVLYGMHPLIVDGYLVYVAPTGNRLLARRFDSRALEMRGDAFPVLEGVRVEVAGAQTAVGGEAFAYVPGEDARGGRFVWAYEGGRLDTLAIPPGLFGEFDISPSGTRLALSAATTDGSAELQMLDLRQLAMGPQERWRPPPTDVNVTWAPDERSLALATSVGYDKGTAYRARLPLGGVVDTLADNFVPHSFTPDGSIMIGLLVDSTGVEIARLPAKGGEVTRVARRAGDQIFSAVSPNGKWLAYMSDEHGSWEVYIDRFPEVDSPRKVSISGGEEPAWSPAGDRLFYRYGNTIYVAPVNRQTGEVGTPKAFVSGPFANVAGYSFRVSENGKRLLLILGPFDETGNHIRVIRDFAAELRRAEARR